MTSLHSHRLCTSILLDDQKMCSTTTCCFNLSPPDFPSTITAKSSSRVSCKKLASPSWRTRSVAVAAVGIAYAMIGIGFVDEDLYLFAYEELSAIAEVSTSDDGVRQRQGRAPARWGNSGACPPWHSKTFELIVPEKLPRPSPHRRWESVGDFNPVGRPSTGAKKGSNGKCFSL